MKRFTRILLCIVAVAFVVRVAYVATAKAGPCRAAIGTVAKSSPSKCGTGDELFYNSAANYLARGHGFNQPFYRFVTPGATGEQPAADHPPLTIVVLAPVGWLVDHPPLAWWINDSLEDHMREQRYAMVVLGTIVVLLVGLLGRRAAGDTVGLVAAGIAAVLPTIWVNDGLVMSETVTNLTVVSALLCAFAVRDRPTVARAMGLGAVCGLATLARAEMLLLLPLLVGALVIAVGGEWKRRVALAGTAVGMALLVLAPWVLYNLSRFEEPTFISTNDGITLAGANCEGVYSGVPIGLWGGGDCLEPYPEGDQSQASAEYRRKAFEFIDANREKVPVVVLARVGRTWSLFRPADMITYNVNEDREEWVTRIGIFTFYPVLVGAVAGSVLLWRRRRRFAVVVLLIPSLIVTTTSAITYGQTRFRAAAEPPLAVLAAVAFVVAWGWLRRSLGKRGGRLLDADVGAG